MSILQIPHHLDQGFFKCLIQRTQLVRLNGCRVQLLINIIGKIRIEMLIILQIFLRIIQRTTHRTTLLIRAALMGRLMKVSVVALAWLVCQDGHIQLAVIIEMLILVKQRKRNKNLTIFLRILKYLHLVKLQKAEQINAKIILLERIIVVQLLVLSRQHMILRMKVLLAMR